MDQQLTTQEMLDEVNNAIFTICVGGQSYRMGSRQLNRADLNTLYKMRNDLAAQVAGTVPGLFDNCCVGFFDGR